MGALMCVRPVDSPSCIFGITIRIQEQLHWRNAAVVPVSVCRIIFPDRVQSPTTWLRSHRPVRPASSAGGRLHFTDPGSGPKTCFCCYLPVRAASNPFVIWNYHARGITPRHEQVCSSVQMSRYSTLLVSASSVPCPCSGTHPLADPSRRSVLYQIQSDR